MAPSDPLIGYSCERMRRLLSKTLTELGLEEIGWSPRSPRAGFASDLVSKGVPFLTVKDLGRWVSEAAARTCIDITASSSILVTFRTRHLSAAMAHACEHPLSFFSEAASSSVRPALSLPPLQSLPAKGQFEEESCENTTSTTNLKSR